MNATDCGSVARMLVSGKKRNAMCSRYYFYCKFIFRSMQVQTYRVRALFLPAKYSGTISIFLHAHPIEPFLKLFKSCELFVIINDGVVPLLLFIFLYTFLIRVIL